MNQGQPARPAARRCDAETQSRSAPQGGPAHPRLALDGQPLRGKARVYALVSKLLNGPIPSEELVMIQVLHIASDTVFTVYGVHKSGPLDEQTKLLVFEPGAGWRWHWAQEFQPVAAAVSSWQPAA